MGKALFSKPNIISLTVATYFTVWAYRKHESVPMNMSYQCVSKYRSAGTLTSLQGKTGMRRFVSKTATCHCVDHQYGSSQGYNSWYPRYRFWWIIVLTLRILPSYYSLPEHTCVVHWDQTASWYQNLIRKPLTIKDSKWASMSRLQQIGARHFQQFKSRFISNILRHLHKQYDCISFQLINHITDLLGFSKNWLSFFYW